MSRSPLRIQRRDANARQEVSITSENLLALVVVLACAAFGRFDLGSIIDKLVIDKLPMVSLPSLSPKPMCRHRHPLLVKNRASSPAVRTLVDVISDHVLVRARTGASKGERHTSRCFVRLLLHHQHQEFDVASFFLPATYSLFIPYPFPPSSVALHVANIEHVAPTEDHVLCA